MFELNGQEVTLDFLKSKAQQSNMDFDAYLEKMKEIRMSLFVIDLMAWERKENLKKYYNLKLLMNVKKN